MLTYDPNEAPDPETWLGSDESERLQSVLAFHQGDSDAAARSELHAVAHTVVENQLAAGDETPVQEALDRLLGEGIDRHQAIHAVGSVFMAHMLESGQQRKPFDLESYAAELRELTVEKWHQDYGPGNAG